jgi:hydroxymethylpyrimidine/phosphomethylpyrimidine kinase
MRSCAEVHDDWLHDDWQHDNWAHDDGVHVMAEGRIPIVLSIAGSDSSGGAGIQADLKTLSALGVYGATAITALTVQNTRGVTGVVVMDPQFVVAQMSAVLDDLDVRAVKTGMLATSGIVSAVAARLALAPQIPVVVDPVMVATSGDELLAPDAVAAIIRDLLPRAALVTPNLAEAARLLDTPIAPDLDTMAEQARGFYTRFGRPVLLKGGHGSGPRAIDVLFDGRILSTYEHPRLATPHMHGTGCTLSAAIAAHLAQGVRLQVAVGRAKRYLSAALDAGQTLGVGHGRGPVDHLYAIRKSLASV